MPFDTLVAGSVGVDAAVVLEDPAGDGQSPDRPEDRSDGEIADGAGEQGFFPPYSWWPMFCALALATIVMGIVIGWWLFIIGVGVGALTVAGWIFEYYRGVHAH